MNRLGIAGSGAIACGLARAAGGSHEVFLWARSDASKDRACAKVEDAATVVTDLSELAGCSVVVEAVSEEMDTKRRLYDLLAGVLDEAAVLATTTSSLSVAESSTLEQARSLELLLRAHSTTSCEPAAARASPQAIAPLPAIPSRFKPLSTFG